MLLDNIRTTIKRFITRSGMSPSYKLAYLNGLLKLGKWLREHEGNAPNFKDRFALYEHINSTVIKDEPIDYLEFGVFKGESIKKWTAIHSHPDSRFFGFDSFVGLPEKWQHFTATTDKGAFDVRGVIPGIEDNRVSFIKGYFQDSMPEFLSNYTPKNRVVIHFDADLYTATLYVMTTMHQFFPQGTLFIFDEFSSAPHEFRAFQDYTSSYLRKFNFLASAEPFYAHTAIEIVK